MYKAIQAAVWYPCSHMIKEKEQAQTLLSYLDLHPHWHLGRDLDEEDRLRRILEPIVVLSSRGRPQLRPEEILVALIPQGANRRRQAAAARAREPSQWEIELEEAHARERYREVAARFEQQYEGRGRGRGCRRASGSKAAGARARGGRGYARGTTGGFGQRESVRVASQGTADGSGLLHHGLATLERDVRADLERLGCEEVAALLEPELALGPAPEE